MIDTHCHLTFDSFDEERDDVIQRAYDAGVKRVIIPAIDTENSAEIVAYIANRNAIFGAVGVHPNSTAAFSAADIDQLRTLAKARHIVAIGEIGLDYHWDKSPKAAQAAAFEAQLSLAAELELPVIIHNREASDDIIVILEAWAKTLPPSLKDRAGVLHSFSAPESIAERALAIGFYLGFSGPITYKNADLTRRVAANAPIDRLVVETDAPFLTPTPHRGKRNEPVYIPLIVDRLASLHQRPIEEMAAITTENADRLFQLPTTSD